jgi:acetylornithine deacetylase/succinyl-diaminopimelate desuccinylase-like protein
VADILALLEAICETPAPTFAEAARAELVARLWREAGLEPHFDEAGNVVTRVPGGSGPRLLVAAHLDTVFTETKIKIRREGRRLAAPGIGDNSASLAVLTYALRHLQGQHLQRRYPRLTVAATVGEEGLGDLRGMRQLMKDKANELDLVIALDGHLGVTVHAAVGSRRFTVHFTAPGGHSWGDFPSPSAVHALGDAIAALNRLSVPRSPRSSYNIGQVSGGTSINAIAQEASFNLDLRSLSTEVLTGLEREAKARIRQAARAHGVECDLAQVGERPAASVPNGQLVKAAQAALAHVGVTARLAASSTDASASMAAGLPSVAFGVYRGGDAHRRSEWLEPESLLTGYQAFMRLLEGVSLLEY